MCYLDHIFIFNLKAMQDICYLDRSPIFNLNSKQNKKYCFISDSHFELLTLIFYRDIYLIDLMLKCLPKQLKSKILLVAEVILRYYELQ